MSRLRSTFGLWLLAEALTCQSAVLKVSPLQKVVELIADLEAEIVAEGRTEAKTYDEFACFCKSKTLSLSHGIRSNQDNIDMFSSDIEDKSADEQERSQQVFEAKKKTEELSLSLRFETDRCAREHAEYTAAAADLAKAISSVSNAVNSLQEGKPRAGLVAIKSVINKSGVLAEAMKTLDQGPRWAASLMQLREEVARVDPSDPEYAFHSHEIIGILDKLLLDFRGKKAQADTEWSKTKAACDGLKHSIETELTSTKSAIELLDEQIANLKKDIGATRRSLVEEDHLLKDNKLYLEDLTKMCESKAKAWDQRSSQRGNEIKALQQALALLRGKATANEDVNERALLQRDDFGTRRYAQGSVVAPPSLFQIGRVRGSSSLSASSHSALRSTDSSGRHLALPGLSNTMAPAPDRRSRAILVLRQEGTRLGSSALSTLAARVESDPFGKVKELLQDLVERLLQEATEEATKKGFCDTELSKAKQDRPFRKQEAAKLAVEVQALSAKEELLAMNIEDVSKALGHLEKDLRDAERIREDEHAESTETLRKAKEGLEAVSEAILILKSFYKQAAKSPAASALLQRKASPVDEDTSGAGFSGSYDGKQAASGGIIGILEVIESDFSRTIETTTKDEAEAHAQFIEYERASKADISGKSTKKELDTEDLETTRRTKDSKMSDLKGAMDLLDAALKRLDKLSPECIDTGMSYEDRIEAREEEINALRKALCILDGQNVEPECGA